MISHGSLSSCSPSHNQGHSPQNNHPHHHPPSRLRRPAAQNFPRRDWDECSTASGYTASTDHRHPRRCHICKQDENLVAPTYKCSTCPRHYHKYCHRDPPIPDTAKSPSFTCRRCNQSQRGASVRPRNGNPKAIDNPSWQRAFRGVPRKPSTLLIDHAHSESREVHSQSVRGKTSDPQSDRWIIDLTKDDVTTVFEHDHSKTALATSTGTSVFKDSNRKDASRTLSATFSRTGNENAKPSETLASPQSVSFTPPVMAPTAVMMSNANKSPRADKRPIVAGQNIGRVTLQTNSKPPKQAKRTITHVESIRCGHCHRRFVPRSEQDVENDERNDLCRECSGTRSSRESRRTSSLGSEIIVATRKRESPVSKENHSSRDESEPGDTPNANTRSKHGEVILLSGEDVLSDWENDMSQWSTHYMESVKSVEQGHQTNASVVPTERADETDVEKYPQATTAKDHDTMSYDRSHGVKDVSFFRSSDAEDAHDTQYSIRQVHNVFMDGPKKKEPKHLHNTHVDLTMLQERETSPGGFSSAPFYVVFEEKVVGKWPRVNMNTEGSVVDDEAKFIDLAEVEAVSQLADGPVKDDDSEGSNDPEFETTSSPHNKLVEESSIQDLGAGGQLMTKHKRTGTNSPTASMVTRHATPTPLARASSVANSCEDVMPLLVVDDPKALSPPEEAVDVTTYGGLPHSKDTCDDILDYSCSNLSLKQMNHLFEIITKGLHDHDDCYEQRIVESFKENRLADEPKVPSASDHTKNIPVHPSDKLSPHLPAGSAQSLQSASTPNVPAETTNGSREGIDHENRASVDQAPESSGLSRLQLDTHSSKPSVRVPNSHSKSAAKRRASLRRRKFIAEHTKRFRLRRKPSLVLRRAGMSQLHSGKKHVDLSTDTSKSLCLVKSTSIRGPQPGIEPEHSDDQNISSVTSEVLIAGGALREDDIEKEMVASACTIDPIVDPVHLSSTCESRSRLDGDIPDADSGFMTGAEQVTGDLSLARQATPILTADSEPSVEPDVAIGDFDSRKHAGGEETSPHFASSAEQKTSSKSKPSITPSRRAHYPPETYMSKSSVYSNVKVCGMALYFASKHRLQTRGVYDWVLKNVPEFPVVLSSVSATLSSNEGTRGKGYWLKSEHGAFDDPSKGTGSWYELCPGVAARFCRDWHLDNFEPVDQAGRLVSDSEKTKSHVEADDQESSNTTKTTSRVVILKFRKLQGRGDLVSLIEKRHQQPEPPPSSSPSLTIDRHETSRKLKRSRSIVKLNSIAPPQMASTKRVETVNDDDHPPQARKRARHTSTQDLTGENQDQVQVLDSEVVPASPATSHTLGEISSEDELPYVDFYKQFPRFRPKVSRAVTEDESLVRVVGPRLTRKQLFKKPAIYSRLGTVTLSHRENRGGHVTATEGASSGAAAVTTVETAGDATQDESLVFGDKIACRTLEEFFDLPKNVIPCIYNDQLAFRDGTRDERGRLPRAKVIYKTGWN